MVSKILPTLITDLSNMTDMSNFTSLSSVTDRTDFLNITSTKASELSGSSMNRRELFTPSVSWIITALYMLISFADFFGNSLVCILSYREKRMRTQYNILLLNLSLADIASGIMIYPYIWTDFTQIPYTGKTAGFLCAISVGLTLFLSCTLTNMFTLCAITVLRYLNIVKHFQRQFVVSDKFIIAYCIFTWVAGVITIIPNAWSFKYNNEERVCYREWPSIMNGSMYSIVTTLIGMIMPVIIMLSFYFMLAKHVWKKSRENARTNIAALRCWKNVAALLGGLILAYLLCWFPFYTTWVLGRAFSYFTDDVNGEYERQRYLRVAMMFSLLNSAIDPLVYAYRNADYRRGFKRILGLEKTKREKFNTTLKLRSASTTASSSNITSL